MAALIRLSQTEPYRIVHDRDRSHYGFQNASSSGRPIMTLLTTARWAGDVGHPIFVFKGGIRLL